MGSVQRVNIQLPGELKSEAERYAERRGESLSAFLRESVRERIDRIRREDREQQLEAAYRAMSEENRRAAEEHEAVDLEGWPE